MEIMDKINKEKIINEISLELTVSNIKFFFEKSYCKNMLFQFLNFRIIQ